MCFDKIFGDIVSDSLVITNQQAMKVQKYLIKISRLEISLQINFCFNPK